MDRSPFRPPRLRRLALRHRPHFWLCRQGICRQHPGGPAGRCGCHRDVLSPGRHQLFGLYPAVYPLCGGHSHHPPGARLHRENSRRGNPAMRCSMASRLAGLCHHRAVLMGPLDWLLLAVIATGTFFALRAVRRGHTGSCCGDCARCRRTDCGKNSKTG